jgi:uroporphyrinogen-III synthase
MVENIAETNALSKIKSILISQPDPGEKSPYAEIVKKYKLKLDFRPFTQVEGTSVNDFRKSRIILSDYTAVFFNSKGAIDHYFRLAAAVKYEPPANLKYFCISESIGVYLQKYVQMRKRKVFFGKGKFDDFFPLMQKHKEDNYLLPSSENPEMAFLAAAAAKGYKIQTSLMYRTVSSDLSDLADVKYDILAFFNPLGIKSLFENFPDFKQDKTRLAVYGRATEEAALNHNLQVNILAPTPEFPSMAMALEEYIKKNK